MVVVFMLCGTKTEETLANYSFDFLSYINQSIRL